MGALSSAIAEAFVSCSERFALSTLDDSAEYEGEEIDEEESNDGGNGRLRRLRGEFESNGGLATLCSGIGGAGIA